MKIKSIRAPRVAYKDSCLSLEDLLRKIEPLTIHKRNLKLFAIKIYKTHDSHNPSFIKQIFVGKDKPYNLRSCKIIFAPKTKGHAIESACFLGPRIWHALPPSTKECGTLNNVKGPMISTVTVHYNCTLCKLHLGNLDLFIV